MTTKDNKEPPETLSDGKNHPTEKTLMKADGKELGQLRGFDAILRLLDAIEYSFSSFLIEFTVVGHQLDPMHPITESKQCLTCEVLAIKDNCIIQELENPFDSRRTDGRFEINVNNNWIPPIFQLKAVEISNKRYRYVDGNLEQLTKDEDQGRNTDTDSSDAQSNEGQTRKGRQTGAPTQANKRSIPDKIPRVSSFSIDYDTLTVEEPLGSGGNAKVSKATVSTSDGRMTLAVKEPRITGTLHTVQVERMLEEAEIWEKLDDHDHIVDVVDYASEPIPWIAMEYMDGGHLGDRAGAMSLPQALWTAFAVTKGVRHAHRRGVAHLDLKPENILFRMVENAWDVPKVADWGLSKHLLEHSKSIEGYTPVYSAPEQLDDGYGQADDITDVYQLGAVFYELFTGRPPFEGDRPGAIIRQILTETPTPPSEITDVPEELDGVLLTALAKEKADRYDDIVYFRDDLKDLYVEWNQSQDEANTAKNDFESHVHHPTEVLRCTECDWATPVPATSLREGDFCPECHKGNLENQT